MSDMGTPSSFSATSPTSTPASKAGPSPATRVMMMPSSTLSPMRLATAGVTSCALSPISGLTTLPRVIRLSIIGRAVSELVAKPIPRAGFSIAVFIPITSPSRFSRGPPLLPSLMAASVWIMS